MTTEELLPRLKAFIESVRDVTQYEGHPAVLIGQAIVEIERLAKERDEARDLVAKLTLEAQIHAGEARAANSTIYEIYQVLSGGTGEPGNWNGAKPAREYVATSEAMVAELREALKPFAEWPGFRPNSVDSTAVWTVTIHSKEKSGLVMSDFALARRALEPSK